MLVFVGNVEAFCTLRWRRLAERSFEVAEVATHFFRKVVTWCQDRRYKNYGCCWLRTKDTVKLLLCFKYMGLICMIFVKTYHAIVPLSHQVGDGFGCNRIWSGHASPTRDRFLDSLTFILVEVFCRMDHSFRFEGLPATTWLPWAECLAHFYDLCYTVSSRSGMWNDLSLKGSIAE